MRRIKGLLLSIALLAGLLVPIWSASAPAEAASRYCATKGAYASTKTTLSQQWRFKSASGKKLGGKARICIYKGAKEGKNAVWWAYAYTPKGTKVLGHERYHYYDQGTSNWNPWFNYGTNKALAVPMPVHHSGDWYGIRFKVKYKGVTYYSPSIRVKYFKK